MFFVIWKKQEKKTSKTSTFKPNATLLFKIYFSRMIADSTKVITFHNMFYRIGIVTPKKHVFFIFAKHVYCLESCRKYMHKLCIFATHVTVWNFKLTLFCSSLPLGTKNNSSYAHILQDKCKINSLKNNSAIWGILMNKVRHHTSPNRYELQSSVCSYFNTYFLLWSLSILFSWK